MLPHLAGSAFVPQGALPKAQPVIRGGLFWNYERR